MSKKHLEPLDCDLLKAARLRSAPFLATRPCFCSSGAMCWAKASSRCCICRRSVEYDPLEAIGRARARRSIAVPAFDFFFIPPFARFKSAVWKAG